MAIHTLATWNIYFSWKMVEKDKGKYVFTKGQEKRVRNVADIINDMDADVLGIQEGTVASFG